MKFSALDIGLAAFCLILLLTLSFGLACGWSELAIVSEKYLALSQIIVFIFSVFFLSLMLLAVIRRIHPLSLGSFELGADMTSTVWKLQGFLYTFNLGLVINSHLIPCNLKALFFSLVGAKMGRSVMIGGKILEPTLVEIGDYSILGEDSILTAHLKESNTVHLGKIVIGRNATVGVKAVVFPDVQIGDDSVIAAGAIVKKGTKIPCGEIWGGIPAKKIRDINKVTT